MILQGFVNSALKRPIQTVSTTAGIAAITFSIPKLAFWAGRKVMEYSKEFQGKWEATALKVAGSSLYVIATISGVAAAIAVGAFVASFKIALFGTLGAMIAGAPGLMVGLIPGILGGAVATGGTLAAVGMELADSICQQDFSNVRVDM